ncbi:MAG: hypothetical protein Barrevirus5_19 [Barrevirus sp.]|uniref:Uncharacterized protein n=1 Tax=Barrevirus sp. TaxID=2487763 RepID=A0A3G4ZPY6_9VIRU|nr:MAG: hypothetical protein Barrevirus5_19 [Barrevirus sp.]
MSYFSSPSAFMPTGPPTFSEVRDPIFVPTGPTTTSKTSRDPIFMPTGPTTFTTSSDPVFLPTGPSYYSPTSPYYSPINQTYVSSDPYLNTDFFVSPTLSPLTVSFDYDRPLIGVYETIDNNPAIRKKMIKYYFDLIRDKWLLDELSDILNYYEVDDDGKVRMIDSLADYSPTNTAEDTNKDAERKVEHIEETILTKYDLIDILNKFAKNLRIKWVDLPKHEYLLKQAVKEYLMREIKRKLKKKNNKD